MIVARKLSSKYDKVQRWWIFNQMNLMRQIVILGVIVAVWLKSPKFTVSLDSLFV